MLWQQRELSGLFLIFNHMTIKIIALSIIIISVVISGFILLSGGSSQNNNQQANNVSMVDGKQIITINAKGGYSPKMMTAKAGIPTVIKMNTNGTFDCSSALRIPSLNYQTNLPPSGETLIDVPPQVAGTAMQGICSMGMYGFAINFTP